MMMVLVAIILVGKGLATLGCEVKERWEKGSLSGSGLPCAGGRSRLGYALYRDGRADV